MDNQLEVKKKVSGGKLYRNFWLISLLVFAILFIYFNFENLNYRYDIAYQFWTVIIGAISFCFWIFSRFLIKLDKILRIVFLTIVVLIISYLVVTTQLITTRVITGSGMGNFMEKKTYLACIICRDYKRGNVVSYSQNKLVRDFSEHIGRIVALPNEEVEVEKAQVRINGKPLNESYADWTGWDKNFKLKTRLNSDEYFILLDKRESGNEFTDIHTIKKSSIVSKLL